MAAHGFFLICVAFAFFTTATFAQNWYCNFEDQCTECNNSAGSCPADISLWKAENECKEKCPEPPDCYLCSREGKCEPGHGLACDRGNPIYRETLAQCSADCAPTLTPPGQGMSRYHCSAGNQCIPCNGLDCPMDKASYATPQECQSECPPTSRYHCSANDQCIPCNGLDCPMDKASYATPQECQSECPPTTADCYICQKEKCMPSYGPMGCNLNDLSVFQKLQQCVAGCPGVKGPMKHPTGSSTVGIPATTLLILGQILLTLIAL